MRAMVAGERPVARRKVQPVHGSGTSPNTEFRSWGAHAAGVCCPAARRTTRPQPSCLRGYPSGNVCHLPRQWGGRFRRAAETHTRAACAPHPTSEFGLIPVKTGKAGQRGCSISAGLLAWKDGPGGRGHPRWPGTGKGPRWDGRSGAGHALKALIYRILSTHLGGFYLAKPGGKGALAGCGVDRKSRRNDWAARLVNK